MTNISIINNYRWLFYLSCIVFFLLLVLRIDCSASSKNIPKVFIPEGYHYPPEHIYNFGSQSDEALVNFRIESNRWPDCYTLETTIQSIFRIEGVLDKSDQAKAFALWKWMRILMNPTGTKYAYEGTGAGKDRVVFDGHKILTVYGHHQCDGLSWVMVPLWRAAGYMAFDEAAHGHTTASLRYKDHDGKYRYHSFDLMRRYYWWDPHLKIVTNWTRPLMQGTVFRHLTLPQKVHSLKTSLHLNEIIERKWENTGHVIPYGRQSGKIKFNNFYKHEMGRTTGVYSSVGMEIQHFSPDLSPEKYHKDLNRLSKDIQSSRLNDNKEFLIHPGKKDQVSEAVYRIFSPYAGVNGSITMTYRMLSQAGKFKLYLSRNGKNWNPIFTAAKKGENEVTIDLGRKQRELGKPNIYTAYTFFLKVEMETSGEITDVGLKDLQVNVFRSLNKRALPNLMPGNNVFKVSADAVESGKALELKMTYKVEGKSVLKKQVISRFPHYFNIQVPDQISGIRKNFGKKFNLGTTKMETIRFRLIDILKSTPLTDSSLDPKKAEQFFLTSSPHPAGDILIKNKEIKSVSKSGAKCDGFFPQSGTFDYKGNDKATRIQNLMNKLKFGNDSDPKTWRAAERLGNYPEALPALLEELPKANIDLTLYICKALSRIKSPESIEPLLNKWEQAPAGSPGTRYIPDVLAAVGDQKVVPDLVKKLKKVRFDYRFHIARALGVLGGDEAEKALYDLSVNDPFPAVREIAGQALLELKNNQ